MGIKSLIIKGVELGVSKGMFTKVTSSTPMAVDVTAEGMKKKNLPRGTGVTYSGIKTSSQGLLVGANTEKKTLLGG